MGHSESGVDGTRARPIEWASRAENDDDDVRGVDRDVERGARDAGAGDADGDSRAHDAAAEDEKGDDDDDENDDENDDDDARCGVSRDARCGAGGSRVVVGR